MNLKIPTDSILHSWITLLSTTEVPQSYQIGVGMAVIGALLKRNVWVDQHSYDDWGWNVYPNQSVMLVGPSGIGKDTAINFAIKQVEQWNTLPVIGGTTIENIKQRLHVLGSPAAAVLPAGEMSAFFGKKDYQSGMLTEITDILSTNEKIDISTKGDLDRGGPKYIHQPTLTMLCGSTEEWLHTAMPDGTMEGGFLGRFLILVEQFGYKQVPLMKNSVTLKQRKKLSNASQTWNTGIERLLQATAKLGEIILLEEAQEAYVNWYYNRFNYFSKAVIPYANRSRDTVLRLAMLMALSRGNFGWIEAQDVDFATRIIIEVGKSIDAAILPPTVAAACAKEMERILPAGEKEITKALGRKYRLKDIFEAKQLLTAEGKMKFVNGKWEGAQ